MNQHLQTILGELYALDPALKTQEKELIPVLEMLMKNKPDAEPDEAFVQRLRMLLKERSSETRNSIPRRARDETRNLFSFLTMHNFNYAITGAIIGALVTAPITYGILQNNGLSPLPSDGSSALFSYEVKDTSNEAFGDLSEMDVSGGLGRGGGAPAIDSTMNARPQSGGGGGEAAMGMDIDQKMMIAPGDITEYKLTFEGEMPALTEQQVEIFKRQRGAAGADMSSILRSFNTGLIDLGSFDDAKTDMLSFYQDSAYGYMINVALREGSISINSNWEKWPHPEANCRDEACYRRLQLSISEIPADDRLIAIAQDFVEDHGIDVSQYGKPEVDNQWRVQYEAMTDKSMAYVPESMRVVYPQLVEGKPIFDEGGGKVGISLGVNVREKRVSDMWGLMDQKYLKSAYPAVTDASKITAYLENMNKMQTSWMPEGTAVKTVIVSLGTPEIGYVKVYTYDSATPEELIVPALIFPVTNLPQGESYYRSTIAVPLAADVLEKMSTPPEIMPMPVDLPLMEENVRIEE
jgi:hypothetical protein